MDNRLTLQRMEYLPKIHQNQDQLVVNHTDIISLDYEKIAKFIREYSKSNLKRRN